MPTFTVRLLCRQLALIRDAAPTHMMGTVAEPRATVRLRVLISLLSILGVVTVLSFPDWSAMAVIVKVSGADGDLLFEAEPTAADLTEIGLFDKAKDVVKEAGTSYEAVTSTLRRCTEEVLSTIDAITAVKSAGGSLSTAELEIGVKITAAGNVIVAKGTAEANLKVVLTWDFQ